MLQAERPAQKSGKQQQYQKHLSKLLKQKNLNTGMMANGKYWGRKMKELYPRDSQNPNTDSPEVQGPEQVAEMNVEIQV